MSLKLIRNKFFLLFFLVFLFLFFSYLENTIDRLSLQKGEFIQSENGNEKANDEKTEKEELVEDETDEGESDIIVVSPTKKIEPTNTSPTIPPVTNGNIDAFIYPNGSVVSKDISSVNIDSSDNPDSITDWYKEKIQSLNMNAVSSVKTNTNGNVLNKIAAGNGDLSVEIEISRSNSGNTTKIVVNLL